MNRKLIAIPAITIAAGLSLAACSSGSSAPAAQSNVFSTPDGGQSLTYNASQIQDAITTEAFPDESAGGVGENAANADASGDVTVVSDTATAGPVENSAGIETATAVATLSDGTTWVVDYICNTNDASGPFSVSLVSQNS